MANASGVLFGVDISHHQKGINFGALKQAGIQYVLARVGQGKGGQYGTTKDTQWIRHRDETRKHNMLLVAYWYIGNGISPQENARLCDEWMGDKTIPVALDCEHGSGNIHFYRQVLDAFRARGLKVVLSYIPRWYWQQNGSPDLSGLPPLWSSRYPDNNPGSIQNEYAGTPESYWNGYGNLPVKVLQFTSSGRIPGYGGNLDINAFKGTREQFAALIGEHSQVIPPEEDEDMKVSYHQSFQLPTTKKESVTFPFEISTSSAHATRGFVSVTANWGSCHVQAWGISRDGENGFAHLPEVTTYNDKVRLSEFDAVKDLTYTWQLPSRLDAIAFEFQALEDTESGAATTLGFTLWGDDK